MPSALIPKVPPCPTCGRPSSAAAAPFCSQGCRDRDLLQWLSDGHRLPGPPTDAEDYPHAGLDS